MSVFENVFAPAARTSSLDHDKLIMSKNKIFREREIFKHTLVPIFKTSKSANMHTSTFHMSKNINLEKSTIETAVR